MLTTWTLPFNSNYWNKSKHFKVKVIRSISDVVAAARANRCHRSDDDDAEADADADADVGRRINEGQSESVSDSGSISDASSEESTPFNKRNFLRGSFERIPILQVTGFSLIQSIRFVIQFVSLNR